ncbi:MAG: cytochrome c, partial [Alphaproteobacteria bacterium]|nr:cytochrome c [Alphaproteobacteria bacterium]
MSRRWILGLICVGGVAILAFFAATWQPEIPPIERPLASSFAPDQVAQGKMLAAVAGCVDCHTRKGRPAGSGGDGMGRMFGVVVPPNITPDPDAGIGRWSLAAFTRAMRDGVTRRGQH